MTGIPSFLRPDVASTFEDRQVASSYRRRPSYPSQVMNILAGLINDEDRVVLDLGCGTGFLARPMAPFVDRVDAIDASTAMIEQGKTLPGGDDPRLNWIVGRAETLAFRPPYALVTAGESLHWMDWDLVLPRISGSLSPNGVLAILDLHGEPSPPDDTLSQGIVDLIRRHTTFDEWREFDVVEELAGRGLFREHDRTETDGVLFRQPVNEYVESFHARASLSWQRMNADSAHTFDSALRKLVVERVGTEVELLVRASVVWGSPLPGGEAVAG